MIVYIGGGAIWFREARVSLNWKPVGLSRKNFVYLLKDSLQRRNEKLNEVFLFDRD
jgi:hypothetical protein